MASGDHHFSEMAEEIAFSVVGWNERFSGLDILTGLNEAWAIWLYL